VNLVRDEVFAPDHILVPLDGSDNSLEVVPYAIAMAKMFDARTTLLCADEGIDVPVVQLMAEVVGGPGPVPLPPRPLVSDQALKKALRLFTDAGVSAAIQGTTGDPAWKILETARQQGAKLIAMTTHGRSGPSRWMLGSVTEKVLRAAEVPMLIVRSPSPRR
jgi:nucleotide-binding universal stress UspA family protein